MAHACRAKRQGSLGSWSKSHGVTRNSTLLFSVPFGMVNVTLPEVAPAGTVAVTWELDTTVNVAGIPLKVTVVVCARLFPRIFTEEPALPEVGSVATNGRSPTEIWKTVPMSSEPPYSVVP